MSIKERIKNEVEIIVAKGHHVEQEVIVFIRHDYANTLNDLQVDMEIERELTLEYLEGVEEGLGSIGHESGRLISQVAETLLDVSRNLGNKSVEAAEKVALEARNALNTALESAQGSMDSLVQKAEVQMQEAYARLIDAGEAGKARLTEVGEGIKAYVDRDKTDLADSVKQSLNSSAESAREFVQQLSQSTEAKSRELIELSRDKVSGWLKEIAEKIKP